MRWHSLGWYLAALLQSGDLWEEAGGAEEAYEHLRLAFKAVRGLHDLHCSAIIPLSLQLSSSALKILLHITFRTDQCTLRFTDSLRMLLPPPRRWHITSVR